MFAARPEQQQEVIDLEDGSDDEEEALALRRPFVVVPPGMRPHGPFARRGPNANRNGNRDNNNQNQDNENPPLELRDHFFAMLEEWDDL